MTRSERNIKHLEERIRLTEKLLVTLPRDKRGTATEGKLKTDLAAMRKALSRHLVAAEK